MFPRFATAPRLFLALALALALTLPHAAHAQEAPAAAAVSATPMTDLPLSAEQRQTYVGTYAVAIPDGGEMVFRIFEENGILKGQPQGEEALRIHNQGNHVFHPDGMPDFVITFTVVDGRGTRFTAKRGEMNLEAIRRP